MTERIVNCPVCESNVLGNKKCRCGYDFEKEEIEDDESIRKTYKEHGSNLQKRLGLLKRIIEIQQKKHGNAIIGSHRGWSRKDTAKMLSQKLTSLNPYLKITEKLDDYPELINCKNISDALRKLKENDSRRLYKKFFKHFDYEEDLHRNLEKNWVNSLFGKEWFLEKSHYRINVAEEIDILAYHKEKPLWLVIELKRTISNDKTIGQIKRYMGYVKKYIAKENEDVHGMIIISYDPVNIYKLKEALYDDTNIEFKIYYRENDEVQFIEEDKDTLEKMLHDELKFAKFSNEEQLNFLDEMIKERLKSS
jgi:hypothetical protein